jgi:hypothetical protein
MDHDYLKISVEEINHILPKLSRHQIMELDQRIHDYLDTSLMTKASEGAFSEWEDPEEDIYNADV